MFVLFLLACTCRSASSPEDRPDVPDVDRAAVEQPTCWQDPAGARLQLGLSGSQEVDGTYTGPTGQEIPLHGVRTGRRIVFDHATAELRGRAVSWKGADGERTFQRTGCTVGRASGIVEGLCDASAAVAWRQRWIVADDETNVLRVYRPGEAKVEQSIALAPLLPGIGEEEADLEGMALDGDLLWLVGSHDSGKKYRPKEARGVLASLRLSEEDGAVVATPVDLWRGLRDSLHDDPRWTDLLERSVGRTSKDVDGFSVEGLALDPRGVHTAGPGLLIGLRAPVLGGRAVVLPLTPGPEGARSWTLGDPLLLDLGGAGVRSLERAEGGWQGISGAPTPGGAFGTFSWADDGTLTRGSAPEGLNPEALWSQGARWWVLSDDGNLDLGGTPCKHAPEAQRRARWAEMPSGPDGQGEAEPDLQ